MGPIKTSPSLQRTQHAADSWHIAQKLGQSCLNCAWGLSCWCLLGIKDTWMSMLTHTRTHTRDGLKEMADERIISKMFFFQNRQ